MPIFVCCVPTPFWCHHEYEKERKNCRHLFFLRSLRALCFCVFVRFLNVQRYKRRLTIAIVSCILVIGCYRDQMILLSLLLLWLIFCDSQIELHSKLNCFVRLFVCMFWNVDNKLSVNFSIYIFFFNLSLLYKHEQMPNFVGLSI